MPTIPPMRNDQLIRAMSPYFLGRNELRSLTTVHLRNNLKIGSGLMSSTVEDNAVIYLQNRSAAPTLINNAVAIYSTNGGLSAKDSSGPYLLQAGTNANALFPAFAYPSTVGCWQLNGGYLNGAFVGGVDHSPNRIGLTRNGTWSQTGTKGPPVAFDMIGCDGSTAYLSRAINANEGTSGTTITFGMWVYLNNVSQSHGLARLGTTTPAWSLLYYKPAGDGYFEFSYWDTSNTWRMAHQVTVTTSGWHFVGFVYYYAASDNYYIRLYVDGVFTSNAAAGYPMRAAAGDFEICRAVGADGSSLFYLYGVPISAFWIRSVAAYSLIEYYHTTKGIFL